MTRHLPLLILIIIWGMLSGSYACAPAVGRWHSLGSIAAMFMIYSVAVIVVVFLMKGVVSPKAIVSSKLLRDAYIL